MNVAEERGITLPLNALLPVGAAGKAAAATLEKNFKGLIIWLYLLWDDIYVLFLFNLYLTKSIIDLGRTLNICWKNKTTSDYGRGYQLPQFNLTTPLITGCELLYILVLLHLQDFCMNVMTLYHHLPGLSLRISQKYRYRVVYYNEEQQTFSLRMNLLVFRLFD